MVDEIGVGSLKKMSVVHKCVKERLFTQRREKLHNIRLVLLCGHGGVEWVLSFLVRMEIGTDILEVIDISDP